MKDNSILLLTKDAQCKSYYPSYGNEYWRGKMPNFEALASKGTVFDRFYTAAPSSNMSYLSMFTMKYPYQQKIKDYSYLLEDYSEETLFSILESEGYECHIIWDDTWDPDIQYTRCYGNSIVHSIHDLRQGVGCHYEHKEPLKPNDKVANETLQKFASVVDSILQSNKKIFLWCHLPHVLNGRTGYGADMDLYDKYIGVFRRYFSDNNIFISADHGNMNGHKGKVCYGFDVYESSINIPLVTPRINNYERCEEVVCNIDLYKIILERIVPTRDFIISDSSYYAQPNRKTAFVKDNFVYIYNKHDGSEELYDLDWDPNQEFNLIENSIYDADRKKTSLASEYYFYPYWGQLKEIKEFFRQERLKMWRTESSTQKVVNSIRTVIARCNALKNAIKWIFGRERW